MWLLVVLAGAAMVMQGVSIEGKAESAMHQIYAAAYLSGGVITIALGLVIWAIVGVRTDLRKLITATREAATQSAASSPAADAAPPAPAASSSAAGNIDRDALSSVQARWAKEEEASPAARQEGLGERERWIVGGVIVVAVVLAWFYL